MFMQWNTFESTPLTDWVLDGPSLTSSHRMNAAFRGKLLTFHHSAHLDFFYSQLSVLIALLLSFRHCRSIFARLLSRCGNCVFRTWYFPLGAHLDVFRISYFLLVGIWMSTSTDPLGIWYWRGWLMWHFPERKLRSFLVGVAWRILSEQNRFKELPEKLGLPLNCRMPPASELMELKD